MAAIDIANWTVNRLKSECTIWSLWTSNGIVDMLTIIPRLRCGSVPDVCGAGVDWLTLHFLRSYMILYSFREIQETGYIRHYARKVQMLMLLFFQVFSLLLIMAGTVFSLEILGELTFMEDSCIENAYGDSISLMTAMYYVIVSVTTVGFGDIVPRSTITRLLSTAFILIGISSIYRIQYEFGQLWTSGREGAVTFTPKAGTKHVVVILGVRGRPSKLSSLLGGFLHEILNSSHQRTSGSFAPKTRSLRPSFQAKRSRAIEYVEAKDIGKTEDWPFVVIFSPGTWNLGESGKGCERGTRIATFDEFLGSLGLPSHARRRVLYVVGSSTSKADLDRAGVGTSMLTFILGDTTSDAPDDDDAQNVFTAVALMNLYSGIHLRVMLDRPESKNLAVQAGIEVSRCFSVRELKANILAQSVRCHGLIPALTGLFHSADADAVENVLQSSRKQVSTARPVDSQLSKGRSLCSMKSFCSINDEPLVSGNLDEWMVPFFQGLHRSVFGFLLCAEYDGRTFGELACDAYEQCGGIVIGVFDRGTLVVCPQNTNRHPLHRGQIIFAISESSSDLDPFRLPLHDHGDWRTVLSRARDAKSRCMREDGVHKQVAKLMRNQLRSKVLFRNDPSGLKTRGQLFQRESCLNFRSMSVRGSSGIDLTYAMDTLSKFAERMNRQTSLATPTCTSLRRCSAVAREAQCEILEWRQDAEGQEIVVLVVCNGEVWQQVRTFVSCLNAEYLPTRWRVIILTPTTPPASLRVDCGEHQVAAIEGSCLSARSLFDAGVAEASSVVVMSGTPPQETDLHEPRFRDYKAILCAQELECWCGFLPRETFTIYELQDSRSVSQLPNLRSTPAMTYDQLFKEEVEPSEEEQHSSQGEREGTETTHGSRCNRFRAPVGQRDKKMSCRKINLPEGNSCLPTEAASMFNPRFAAGQVFTTEVWGAMLGHMFYMPALIELLEALVMPDRRGQSAFFWHIRVLPKYAGRPCSRLFRDMVLGGWDKDDKDEQSPCKNTLTPGIPHLPCSREGSPSQPHEGPSVPLAVYRLRDDIGPGLLRRGATPTYDESDDETEKEEDFGLAQGTGGYHYNILAPPPKFILRSNDWVLVLGSREFGRRANEIGILRGNHQGHMSKRRPCARGSFPGPRAPSYTDGVDPSGPPATPLSATGASGVHAAAVEIVANERAVAEINIGIGLGMSDDDVGTAPASDGALPEGCTIPLPTEGPCSITEAHLAAQLLAATRVSMPTVAQTASEQQSSMSRKSVLRTRSSECAQNPALPNSMLALIPEPTIDLRDQRVHEKRST
eukprot:TRINITY_DN20594_c0_g1_i1.p1 TRINITY_DN20594_c0_g1~~TRINITY_DN20594_c0_g1_i1.p1  ORF type:complete len:1504 (+),score=188.44 TRINITY_DN20594_c0_g1_i1:635-4513(+)